MRRLLILSFILCMAGQARAQTLDQMLASLPRPHDYVLKTVSSYDRTGGNADSRTIAPGGTLTLIDADGPGVITHLWVTIADGEPYHLKKLLLKMYWDGEPNPSVLAPIGDFFGLGLGEYFTYQSLPLAVASNKALNCFFPMPFARHARITITNQGHDRVQAFYYSVEYRALAQPLAKDTLYFHAQYRQATPNHGIPGNTINRDGKDNYVWMEAKGRGHYVGVTMSVIENQDGWWGEGDDMFFIDGEKLPSINGTGTEDYFLGAWDFSGGPFSYLLFGAPVRGQELEGQRWSVYRFHLDSPITFTKSLRATIEHGTANNRSDNFYSVAYWYQTEPHAPFPPMPDVEDRLPRVIPVGAQ
ncbi:MAG TPA: glycoside hydrolase family 172 protein [Terriglobia bacterium]|nr:glycoside hydrolase family 172 protein [Terriglobia bacterium]